MMHRSEDPAVVRRVEPVYVVHSGELLIEAPVEVTWRHVMDYASWQNFRVFQHLSGARGQEGEVVLLKKEEAGFDFPAYKARTIKLVPESQIIWKQYTDEESEGINFFGLVTFRVAAVPVGTRFWYDLVFEFLVPYDDVSELDAFRGRQHENFARLTSSVFPRLKRRAEER